MTLDRFLADLIAVGKSEDFECLGSVVRRASGVSLGYVNGESPEFWETLTRNFTTDDTIGLIKALTIAEQKHGFGGGCVAPVIWILRTLRTNRPGDYSDLDRWILDNTDNPYLPWGGLTNGARSFQEYQSIRGAHARSRNFSIAEEKTNRERKVEKATRNLFGAIQRGDPEAIIGLRRRGADVDFAGPDGRTARELAELSGDERILQAVLNDLT